MSKKKKKHLNSKEINLNSKNNFINKSENHKKINSKDENNKKIFTTVNAKFDLSIEKIKKETGEKQKREIVSKIQELNDKIYDQIFLGIEKIKDLINILTEFKDSNFKNLILKKLSTESLEQYNLTNLVNNLKEFYVKYAEKHELEILFNIYYRYYLIIDFYSQKNSDNQFIIELVNEDLFKNEIIQFKKILNPETNDLKTIKSVLTKIIASFSYQLALNYHLTDNKEDFFAFLKNDIKKKSKKINENEIDLKNIDKNEINKNKVGLKNIDKNINKNEIDLKKIDKNEINENEIDYKSMNKIFIFNCLYFFRKKNLEIEKEWLYVIIQIVDELCNFDKKFEIKFKTHFLFELINKCISNFDYLSSEIKEKKEKVQEKNQTEKGQEDEGENKKIEKGASEILKIIKELILKKSPNAIIAGFIKSIISAIFNENDEYQSILIKNEKGTITFNVDNIFTSSLSKINDNLLNILNPFTYINISPSIISGVLKDFVIIESEHHKKSKIMPFESLRNFFTSFKSSILDNFEINKKTKKKEILNQENNKIQAIEYQSENNNRIAALMIEHNHAISRLYEKQEKLLSIEGDGNKNIKKENPNIEKNNQIIKVSNNLAIIKKTKKEEEKEIKNQEKLEKLTRTKEEKKININKEFSIYVVPWINFLRENKLSLLNCALLCEEFIKNKENDQTIKDLIDFSDPINLFEIGVDAFQEELNYSEILKINFEEKINYNSFFKLQLRSIIIELNSEVQSSDPSGINDICNFEINILKKKIDIKLLYKDIYYINTKDYFIQFCKNTEILPLENKQKQRMINIKNLQTVEFEPAKLLIQSTVDSNYEINKEIIIKISLAMSKNVSDSKKNKEEKADQDKKKKKDREKELIKIITTPSVKQIYGSFFLINVLYILFFIFNMEEEVLKEEDQEIKIKKLALDFIPLELNLNNATIKGVLEYLVKMMTEKIKLENINDMECIGNPLITFNIKNEEKKKIKRHLFSRDETFEFNQLSLNCNESKDPFFFIDYSKKTEINLDKERSLIDIYHIANIFEFEQSKSKEDILLREKTNLCFDAIQQNNHHLLIKQTDLMLKIYNSVSLKKIKLDKTQWDKVEYYNFIIPLLEILESNNVEFYKYLLNLKSSLFQKNSTLKSIESIFKETDSVDLIKQSLKFKLKTIFETSESIKIKVYGEIPYADENFYQLLANIKENYQDNYEILFLNGLIKKKAEKISYYKMIFVIFYKYILYFTNLYKQVKMNFRLENNNEFKKYSLLNLFNIEKKNNELYSSINNDFMIYFLLNIIALGDSFSGFFSKNYNSNLQYYIKEIKSEIIEFFELYSFLDIDLFRKYEEKTENEILSYLFFLNILNASNKKQNFEEKIKTIVKNCPENIQFLIYLDTKTRESMIECFSKIIILKHLEKIKNLIEEATEEQKLQISNFLEIIGYKIPISSENNPLENMLDCDALNKKDHKTLIKFFFEKTKEILLESKKISILNFNIKIKEETEEKKFLIQKLEFELYIKKIIFFENLNNSNNSNNLQKLNVILEYLNNYLNTYCDSSDFIFLVNIKNSIEKIISKNPNSQSFKGQKYEKKFAIKHDSKYNYNSRKTNQQNEKIYTLEDLQTEDLYQNNFNNHQTLKDIKKTLKTKKIEEVSIFSEDITPETKFNTNNLNIDSSGNNSFKKEILRNRSADQNEIINSIQGKNINNIQTTELNQEDNNSLNNIQTTELNQEDNNSLNIKTETLTQQYNINSSSLNKRNNEKRNARIIVCTIFIITTAFRSIMIDEKIRNKICSLFKKKKVL